MANKKKNKNQVAQTSSFKVNDIIFAKLRGYAIWPGKIIGIGKKIDVVFYGDRTCASLGKNSISPFNTNVDVSKHRNTKGYEMAMQEAIIDGIKSSNKSNRAAETTRRPTSKKSHPARMKTSENAEDSSALRRSERIGAKNSKHVTIRDSVTRICIQSWKSKEEMQMIKNTSTCGCVTRSKSANTQSAHTESEYIPVIRSRPSTKNARAMKKMKNSV